RRGVAGKPGDAAVGELMADVDHQYRRRGEHEDEQQDHDAQDPPSHRLASAVSSWSRPYGVSSACASRPSSRSRWAKGTAYPWVTSTREAPVSWRVSSSAGQSAWSESAKPRSTLL